MDEKKTLFKDHPDILPILPEKGMTVSDMIQYMGGISFEARNIFKGACLLKKMIDAGDVVWLGIAGAGIAGGMGGIVISLLESGFIDAICSTGAQVYHDLHFAFGLPVKSISPFWDDDQLRSHGDTRIYDIGIREKETLKAQDEIIRDFVRSSFEKLPDRPLSSWEFNYFLGQWVEKNAPYPDRSFVCRAASLDVPVFWDSLANHSIAMNLVLTDREGYPVSLSAQKDILDSAAIVYSSERTGFVELGGGGPKNFIQQTGPTISQILGIDFEGADRGLQIGTAPEREGSLSGCTFGEAVTWGKYRTTGAQDMVQIWGDYSVIFPLLAVYALDQCKPRPHRMLARRFPDMAHKLEGA